MNKLIVIIQLKLSALIGRINLRPVMDVDPLNGVYLNLNLATDETKFFDLPFN